MMTVDKELAEQRIEELENQIKERTISWFH